MRPVAAIRTAGLLRVLSALLTLAAATILAVPAASGQTEPTDLGSYGFRAAAHGGRVDLGSDVAGTVPDAAASLDTGGIAYGRASMAWPGPLAANAGDLIILASGGQIPPEMEPTFRMLNYPVRAEARSPGGPEEASFDDAPGATMTAATSSRHADAVAAVQRVEVPGLGSLGATHTNVKTELAEGLGRSISESVVSDVEIGGLLRIESVRSRAETTSDGEAATAEATTTVSGVTVAGTPATLDEDGLSIGTDGEATPINEAANEIAEQAFRESGMVVFVTESTTVEDGPESGAFAGSVLIALSDDGPFVVLGGASASSVAGKAFSFPPPVLDVAAGPPDVAPSAPSVGGPGASPVAAAPPVPQSAAGPATGGPAPILSAAATDFPDADLAGILVIGSLIALLASRFLRTLAGCVGDDSARCPLQGVP